MQTSDAELRVQEVIAVGEAYQPARDMREILGLLFSVGMALGAIASVLYATLADRWEVASVALILGLAASAAIGAVLPWTRLRREWQLVSYWLSIGAVYASPNPSSAAPSILVASL